MALAAAALFFFGKKKKKSDESQEGRKTMKEKGKSAADKPTKGPLGRKAWGEEGGEAGMDGSRFSVTNPMHTSAAAAAAGSGVGKVTLDIRDAPVGGEEGGGGTAPQGVRGRRGGKGGELESTMNSSSIGSPPLSKSIIERMSQIKANTFHAMNPLVQRREGEEGGSGGGGEESAWKRLPHISKFS